jgi:hypothetical protein
MWRRRYHIAAMTHVVRKCAAAVAVAAAMAAAGCGDDPDAVPPPESVSPPVDRVARTSLVALVQGSASPEGGMTDAWLKKQLGQVKGETMFPQWSVERRGTSKYEVQFTYTLIDVDNRIVKRGFAWSVDAGLQLVGPPREISPEYAPSYNRSGNAQDEYRRAKEIQAELE